VEVVRQPDDDDVGVGCSIAAARSVVDDSMSHRSANAAARSALRE
jgi:hypothetical protein